MSRLADSPAEAMTMRPMIASILLLAPALAGCIQVDPVDAAATESELQLTPLDLKACYDVWAWVGVPASEASSSTPDGFELVPFQGVPGTATRAIVAYSCDAATGKRVLIEESFEGYVVTPPDDVATDAIHLLLERAIVTNETRATVFAEWAPGRVQLGRVAVGYNVEGPNGYVGGASLTTEDRILSVRVDGGFAESGQPHPVRVFAADAQTGEVSGWLDIISSESIVQKGRANLNEFRALPVPAASPEPTTVRAGHAEHYWSGESTRELRYTVANMPE